MLWTIFFTVLLVYIAIKSYENLYYWKIRGVKHVRAWPFTGTFIKSTFRIKNLIEELHDVYKKYPDAKFVGIHQVNRPMLMIRDPELIKQVTVKSFDSFADHTVLFTPDVDPLFGRTLISLKGREWRDMRATLSPAFTSSKMRKMYILIKECSEQFTEHFLQLAKDKGTVELEMLDIFTKYTNDVIATCAFGIECNSLKNEDNEFYTTGKKISTFSFKTIMKFMALMIMPAIMKMLGASLLPEEIANFFRNIIKSNIEQREKNNIIRPDMIQLLMEARKGQLKHEVEVDEDAGFATVEESNLVYREKGHYGTIITRLIITFNPYVGQGAIESDFIDQEIIRIFMSKEHKRLPLSDDDITAQALLFFMAGYDTVSTMMHLLAYELAVNPDIQKKLQDEIDTILQACNGNIDYESLLQMKYLDMVISESLRKWPPAAVTERICNSPFKFIDEDQVVLLEKDKSIWVPVHGLHHDEKYYPNPEKFDPERFSEENKNNIQPFTYLPFGVGPRNCIGSRFALLEIKSLVTSILSKFDIVPISKTVIPLKLSKSQFAMKTDSGVWLGFKRRVL